MHVAFALLTLFPGQVGGAESNVRGVLGQFADGNGPERVTVLANRDVAASYGGYVGGPIDLCEVRSYRAGRGRATRLMAMAGAAVAPRLVARGVPRGFDVLHHPVTVPIPRLRGVPTVTTVYDLQHRELPGFFSRGELAYRRWAYEGAARAADLVLTTSEYSRERLIELAGVAPTRAVAIPMGIDHARFTPRATEVDETLSKQLSLPERYIVYPANLWPHKNHERLIAALGATPSDVHLVLTGQDYGRLAEIERCARQARVSDRVRHLGYLQSDQVPALYRLATAMVFPSLYEGFGSPPLEAMACGCPVSCATSGSLAEVVGDAALTFDPRSVDAIAASVERIVDDRALGAELRVKGLERAGGFTWSEAARRHRDAYALAASSPHAALDRSARSGDSSRH